ncbi:hypothetical protein JCM10213v2_003450 [Rhodosporidiobolus nylandii]
MPPNLAFGQPPFYPAFPSPNAAFTPLGPPPRMTFPSPAPPGQSRPSTANASPSFSFATLAPAHAPTPNAAGPPTPAPPNSAPAPNTFGDDLDLLAPLPHLALKPGEDLDDFFASLDAELGSWEPALSSSAGAGSPPLDLPVGRSGNQPSPDSSSFVYSSGLTPALSGAVGPASPPVITVAASRKASLQAESAAAILAKQPPPGAGDASPDSPIEELVPGWLDPVYNTFNDGFFRSLPKPVRDVVCRNVYDVVVSSELSRNAGMAMVMLYRLRMQQQEAAADANDAEDAASKAKQHAQLLAQSNHYFQRALEHIQTPIPFEAKMVAVLDMQTYQYDQWGAAASNAIVLLGEYFVNEELGPQPALDLTTASVLLSTFGWTDCVRCLCIPGRRTIFTYSNLPGEPHPESPNLLLTDVSSVPSDVQVHLGLPVGLMLCIAATANLSTEMEALPDELVRFKADAIEKAIRGWRQPIADPSELADGAAFMEKLSTAEMWRHAIIIFLYQVVHKHGSLSKALRDAMSQILTIGGGLLTRHPASSTSSSSSSTTLPQPKDDYLSASANRAVPFFLAGTVASSAQDRAVCKKGLEVCGPLQGYRDNVAALERIWEVVDGKGWTVDWRALLQAERRFVGFL